MDNSAAGTVLTPAFLNDGPWLTDEEVLAITGYAATYLYNLRSRGGLPKSTKVVIDAVDRHGRPIRVAKGFNKAADLRDWLIAHGRPEKVDALDAYISQRRGDA